MKNGDFPKLCQFLINYDMEIHGGFRRFWLPPVIIHFRLAYSMK